MEGVKFKKSRQPIESATGLPVAFLFLCRFLVMPEQQLSQYSKYSEQKARHTAATKNREESANIDIFKSDKTQDSKTDGAYGNTRETENTGRYEITFHPWVFQNIT
jgi:hypothetical protein